MSKLSKIYALVCSILCGMIGFFIGGILEQSTHGQEIELNWNEIETKQAIIDQYENTADYNAQFNLKAREVTNPCRTCSLLLSEVQVELDSLQKFDGKLVVPGIVRNLNDR